MSDASADAIEKPFRQFERQAGRRLRVARAAGFDTAEVEKVNAKEREELFDRVVAPRIQPLQDLLRDLDEAEANPSQTPISSPRNGA